MNRIIAFTFSIILVCLAVAHTNGQIIRLTLPMDGGGNPTGNPGGIIESACVPQQTRTALHFNLHNDGDYLIEITNVGVAITPANVMNNYSWGESIFIMPGTWYEFEYDYFFLPTANGETNITALLDVQYKVHMYLNDENRPPTEHQETLEVSSPICENNPNSPGRTQRSAALPVATDVSISPNPVIHTFAVNYTLAKDETVSIDLYDNTGRKISTIQAPTQQTEGTYRVDTEFPKGLNSGIYYTILRLGKATITQRLVKR